MATEYRSSGTHIFSERRKNPLPSGRGGCQFTKLGLESFDPVSFAHLRSACAVFALAATAAFSARHHGRIRLNIRDHLLAVFLGMLGMACFPFCFSLAMKYTSAANAGLIFGATPVAVALISWIFSMEELDRKQLKGLVLSFAGIVFIMLPEGLSFSLSTLKGDLLMTAAMLNWALYTVINRFVRTDLPALQFTAYAALWGAAGLTVMSSGRLAGLDLNEVKTVSWLGGLCAGILSTAVSYVIWNTSVQAVGPSKTAVYLNLVPLVAGVSGFILLNESLGWNHLPSAVLIIAGVLMTRGGGPH